MFSKATAKFVYQIDPDGRLIHVSRVIDSDKLVPMALVVKRKRFWYWQKPKYHPTDFTLSDLLGEPLIQAGVSESDFVSSYKGSFGDKLSGKVETEAGALKVSVEGKGNSSLQSCFGPLIKEELDVKKLLRDSRNRYVDMEHELVTQLEKNAEVLAVVKERIFTTTSCCITQTKSEHCTFQGVIQLLGMLSGPLKVLVKDCNGIELDSDVSLEIPSHTVVAYSILELEIKKDGRCGICLQPRCSGGFKADSFVESWPSNVDVNAVDGSHNGQEDKVPLRALLNGSEEMDLSPLAELPQSRRQSFFDKLQKAMMERPALTCLQCVLEELCGSADTDNLSEGHSELVSAILGPASSDGQSENGHCGVVAQLKAAYLLVSAIAELPDESLELLRTSKADFLEALDTLICRFKESSEPLSVQTLPVLLQENHSLQPVEQLLATVRVALRRDDVTVWAGTELRAGVLPLVLCLSIHGLAILCNGLK